MKRLFVLAVVLALLVVMVSSVSASPLGMMPSSNPCPVCTVEGESTESVLVSPLTDPDAERGGKATPILF